MDALADCIPDPRHSSLIQHSQKEMLAQRIYSIAIGYEDLNNHDALRRDPALQVATELVRKEDEGQDLSSPSTLCRLENRISRESLTRIAKVFVEQFIASHDTPPEEIVLDFDATDDPLHGHQEKRFFRGYYDCYCYLPLYVFRGDQLLVSYLRPSGIDGTKHNMENRIKEQQLRLFADRTSCHSILANQFRLFLSAAAYMLIESIRRLALKGTELAREQVDTIRIKLFKIASRVIKSVRRIVFHMTSGYPYQ